MVIGLTGTMGSGKTEVLNLFKDLGAAVYIADVEAKILMNSSLELKDKICNTFGKESYVKGKLNASFLSNIVFNNPDKLAVLNSFVHPAVQKSFLEFVSSSTARYVVFESAILFQSKIQDHCDFILVVTAPLEVRVDRIMQRDAMSKEDIESRLMHQSTSEEMILKSDFVIENLDLKSTKKEVFRLHQLFLSKS